MRLTKHREVRRNREELGEVCSGRVKLDVLSLIPWFLLIRLIYRHNKEIIYLMNYAFQYKLSLRLRTTAIAILAAIVLCAGGSSVFADAYTHWFDPIELVTPFSNETVEVVLQVSPGVAPGPYEYVYWVTNNTSSELTEFFLTTVGSDDPTAFDAHSFRVIEGTRSGTEIYWGADSYDWGDFTSGTTSRPQVIHRSFYDENTQSWLGTTKFRWTTMGMGLAPGDTIGFSFINLYAPELFANSIASAMAYDNYNAYVYGPGTEPDIPEWPAVAMAASGFGLIGFVKRRFVRS